MYNTDNFHRINRKTGARYSKQSSVGGPSKKVLRAIKRREHLAVMNDRKALGILFKNRGRWPSVLSDVRFATPFEAHLFGSTVVCTLQDGFRIPIKATASPRQDRAFHPKKEKLYAVVPVHKNGTSFDHFAASFSHIVDELYREPARS
jgi:hypothetical protein